MGSIRQNIARIDCREAHDAADGARSVNRRGRPAGHIDRLHHLWVKIESAFGGMAFALEILPRSIDKNVDAAEILEPTDVDAYARIPWS
jgi:hypothetical protein